MSPRISYRGNTPVDEEAHLLTEDEWAARSSAFETQAHLDANTWISQHVRDVFMPPQGEDVPTIALTTPMATALTTPVEYKPAVVGIGSQTLGWDGKSDPNILFGSGFYDTKNGANQDIGLVGAVKPGGVAQAAKWNVFASFTTTAVTIELAFYAVTTTSTPIITVNGRPLTEMVVPRVVTGQSYKMTLTFPTSKSRTIGIVGDANLGLGAIRVPTGGTITKPAAPKRRIAFIGDSWINGAGAYADGGAGSLDTFARRLARMMGADDVILAGIGGTGWVAGTDTGGASNAFGTRLPTVLAMQPHAIVFLGSINDGAAGTGVQAAVEAALDQCASIPQVYVVGPPLSGYETNNAAVKAGTLAKGRKFIDAGGFLYGTGKVGSPKGDGNRDFWLQADGAHPTYAGHKALAERIFRGIYSR
ncbi:hypothetical protein [Streptomyces phage phiScoe10]|nr:hypothetical protein [Streptomyces phage phiScoe10]